MTTQPRYPKYRDVNQRFLIQIPTGWGLSRLRYLCDIGTGSGDTVDAEPEGDYPFVVRSPDVLRASTYDHDCEAILTVGDGAVGEVFHHVSGRFLAHQRVYVLTSIRGVESRFLFYFFSSLFRYMARDGSARTTVDSVRRWMLTDMPVALPPRSDQLRIVWYLDRETAQIDTLIAEQERLIELLRERREAVIIGGVFGLRSDSGSRRRLRSIGRHRAIEPALNRMPSSWSVERFRAVLSRCDERNLGLVFPMLSLKSNGQVVPRSSLGDRQEPSKSSLPRYLIARRGDLVVNPMWLIGGAIGVAEFDGAVSPDYRVFRSSGVHVPRYLHHLLRSRPYRDQYVLYTRAQTTFDRRVQQPDLDNMPIPIPPISEQREISERIDRSLGKIDTLITETERFIELAKERRAALITAAVTGQIDVREVA